MHQEVLSRAERSWLSSGKGFFLSRRLIPAAAFLVVAATAFASAPMPKPNLRCGGAEMCLAVRFVAYRDENGDPGIAEADAKAVMAIVNQVWSQCGIGFLIEEYASVDPGAHGLTYRTKEHRELSSLRRRLGADAKLLVVITGPWERTGSLGSTRANAWTSMPGSGPNGAVLERPVGRNANLIAHELGHSLGLYHVENADDLMNPVIYSRSKRITATECDTARSTVKRTWSDMVR